MKLSSQSLDRAIDAQLCEAVNALLDATNLWYAEASLSLRNFTDNTAFVVARSTSTEAEETPTAQARAEAALARLEKAEVRTLAEWMSRNGVHEDAREEMRFEPIDAEAALERFAAHVAAVQPGDVRARVEAIFAAFADHRIWDLGDRRYWRLPTTSLWLASPSQHRVALLEYVGDGP